MKKIIAMVLCLVLVFSLAGCGNNDQSSDTHDANYEEGYTAGYEDIMMGSSKWPKTKSTLHSFRDLLQLPLSNSCRITVRFREKRLP